MIRLHLIGAKTRRQMSAYVTMARAAAHDGVAAPPPPSLDFAGFSGRGVRVRMLSPFEKDQATADAARLVGADATVPEYQRRRDRECALRCIREVTRERELDEAGLAKATWTKVSMQDLETPGGELHAAKLFTSKDIDALIGWFRETHNAEMADVEAILGNAVELSADGG